MRWQDVDKGYEGSLIPLELNMGDQVLTSLRSNSQLDLGIYQQEKSSIRSKIRKILCGDRDTGNFSTDMMSLFSENIQ